MPPKARFSKEEIVSMALQITREHGIGAVTARELGARLGSSARPIFTVFQNMEEVNGNNYVGGITGYLRKYGKLEQAVNTAYICSKGCDSDYYSRTGGIIGCTGENVSVSV